MEALEDLEEALEALVEKAGGNIADMAKIIIEEPEQNLYPFAQVELLQNAVRLCNEGDRNHSFTITTHSPYILNYLNVLIMRDSRAVTGKPSLDVETIGVYAVQNGGVLNLVQTNTATGAKSVNAEWLNEAMRAMYDEYKELKGMGG